MWGRLSGRRLGPVTGLFVLSPFIGEFVLGNLRITELWLGLFLAPLYGCGAILVREIGRWSGGGWPTMVLLATAYALIEEGPVDQLLWNDSYAGADLLHGPSFIPALGMSIELTQIILALHTVWSICVPIILIESFVPDRRTIPWLGRRGLLTTAIVYLIGAIFIFIATYAEERFLASPVQMIATGIVIASLIGLAFLIRRVHLPRLEGRAPSRVLVGLAALAGTSLYWGPANLIADDWYEWVGVAVWCAVAGASVILISSWSRTPGWGATHLYALAVGATLTYVWVAFPLRPETGGSQTVDLIGNAVFGAIAVLILVLAGRSVIRAPTPPEQ